MKFKKGDAAALIFSLLLIMFSFILVFIYTHSNSGLNYIEIINDKKIVSKIYFTKLSSEKIVEVKTNIGIMKIHIDKNGAYVSETHCNDKLCEKFGKITKPYQSIICLPQKIEITIKNENSKNNRFDTVNR